MAKPTYIRGEILPPQSQSAFPELAVTQATTDEHLNLVATWLDDRFEIPGTRIRFGLDALIGWIPGIGDALAAVASLFIVFAAWKRGAARITVLRMMLNLAIEDTLGAIPIIGDVAHVAWKANRRNYNLLIRDQQGQRQHTWQDVIAACLIMLLLTLAPFVLLIYLFKHTTWATLKF
jgi:branched-subunit amino acid ABC-type transport system permease component